MTRYAGRLCCLLVWAAMALSAAAHELAETTPAPGFRPDSEHAGEFVNAVNTATIAVHPTIVRRSGRTAHSFASQKRVIAFLNDEKIAVAVTGRRRVDFGRLLAASQWELFQSDMNAIAEQLQSAPPGADYELFMEFLLPVSDDSIFGIHCYVLDRNGENAFSFLLNSHHRLFADARLVATDSSEEARDRMMEKATDVGLTALKLQIEQAPRGDPAGAFLHESPIDETSSIMTLAQPGAGEGSVAEKSMKLMCECADITLARGFSYFRVEDPGQISDKTKRFKIVYYDAAPAELPVFDFEQWQEQAAASGQGVVDAREAAPFCELLGSLPAAEPVADANRIPGSMPSPCTDAPKAEYPVNELPMYGHVEKTAAQKRADERYVDYMTREGQSRKVAAELAARLGWNTYYAGDCAAAIRRFNQAWLLDPDNQHALWGFAVISLERGRFDEAVKYFRMAVENGPENPALRKDYERALTMLEP